MRHEVFGIPVKGTLDSATGKVTTTAPAKPEALCDLCQRPLDKNKRSKGTRPRALVEYDGQQWTVHANPCAEKVRSGRF